MSFFRKTKQSGINLDWGRKNLTTKRDMSGYWYNVSRNFNLTQNDVREFQDKIDWDVLSMNKGFPFDDAFLAEFANKINWDAYAIRHPMTEQQYLKFKKYIHAVYFIAGQGKETKEAMAEKYFNDVSPTRNWVDHTEDLGGYCTFKRNYSEREYLLFNMRGISPKFVIEHISTPEEWKKFSRNLQNPKLILKYWDKVDKDSLFHLLHGKMGYGINRFPETWKPVAEKLRPYFEERKKTKLNSKKSWQNQDEQRLRNDFDEAYNKIKKEKEDWEKYMKDRQEFLDYNS